MVSSEKSSHGLRPPERRRPFGAILFLSAVLCVSGCSSAPEKGEAPVDATGSAARIFSVQAPLIRCAPPGMPALDLQCEVKLPGDVTSNNRTICPSFALAAVGPGGKVHARFRFSRRGLFRLPFNGQMPLILVTDADERKWKVTFEPPGPFRRPEEVKALFIRKP